MKETRPRIWRLAMALLAGGLLISSFLTLAEIRTKSQSLSHLENLHSLLEQAALELRLAPWVEEPDTGSHYQSEFNNLLGNLRRDAGSEYAFLNPIKRDQLLLRPEEGEAAVKGPLKELSTLIIRISRDELPSLRTRLKLKLGCCGFFLLVLLAHEIWALVGRRTKRHRDPEVRGTASKPLSSLPLSFTEAALKAQHPQEMPAGTSARGYTERVLQSLSNLLILAGRDGTIQMTNQAVADILGYTQGELLGLHLNKLLPENAADECPTLGEFETQYLAKDGSRIPVQVSSSAVFDEAGGIDGLVIVAKDISERKATERVIRANEARLRNLAERLVSAQEDERQRVARDLHDGMLQSVIAAELQMNSAIRKWKKKLDEEEPKSLRYGLECLKEAVAQGRRLIHDLRPPTLDQFGLVKSLRHEASRFGQHNQIEVTLVAPKDDTEFPRQLETAFHRIFQECLSNVLKHAEAKKVQASLNVEGPWVILKVEDDGKGFEQTKSKRGIGLHSMKERTELLGGRLSISSQPGQGTTTTARIPFQSSTC